MSDINWFDMHTIMALKAMERLGLEVRGGAPRLPQSSLYLVTRWARGHFHRFAPCWTKVRRNPDTLLKVIPELIRSGQFNPIEIGLVPTLHGRYGERVVRAAILKAIEEHRATT